MKPQTLVSGLAAAVIAQALAMLSSLLIVMLASRTISQEQLGGYFLGLIVIQFTVAIGDVGLRNAAIKFLSNPDHSPDSTFPAYVLTIGACRALVAGGILWATMPWISRLWPVLGDAVFRQMVVVVSALTILQQVAIAISASRKQFVVMGKVSIIAEALRFPATVALLYAGAGAPSLLVGIALARLSVIWGFVRRNRDLISFVPRHPRARELFHFSGKLYGASLISVMSVRAAEVFVASKLGAAPLAVYSAAGQIPQAMARLFEAMRPALIGVASQSSSDHSGSVQTLIRLVIASCGPIAVLLIYFADEIVVTAFSADYRGGGNILVLLAAWMCSHLTVYAYTISLTGEGSGRAVIALQAVQAVAILILLSLVVERYEAVGAAASLLVASAIGNGTGIFLLGRRKKDVMRNLSKFVLLGYLPVAVACLFQMAGVTSVLLGVGLFFAAIAWYRAVEMVTKADVKACWSLVPTLRRKKG